MEDTIPDPDSQCPAPEVPAISKRTKHTDHAPLCANCSQPLPDDDIVFCPHCGQQNQSSKVSLGDFLRRFFQHLTHLDNKFVRTLRALFVPGKMTEVYFQGKRKRYPHPVQLFFVAMFFFLLAATPAMLNNVNITLSNKDEARQEHFRGASFYDLLQRHAVSLQLHALMDSLPPHMRTAEHRQVVDSLLSRSHDAPLRNFQRILFMGEKARKEGKSALTDTSLVTSTPGFWTTTDSISIGIGITDYTFDVRDIVFLSDEELMRRYDIHSKINQVLIKQSIKTLYDPAALMKFYVGSFSWTVFMLAAVMAVFMLLLYRQQKRYYIEHFVFLLHGQSALLLVLAVLFGLHRLYPLIAPGVWYIAVMCWAAIALFWAMKRYYHTSWVGTIWRWLLFVVVYLFAFTLFFSLGLMLAILLF